MRTVAGLLALALFGCEPFLDDPLLPGDGPRPGGGEPAEPRLEAPYPIVLAHGFFGFDTFAGLDFLTYFDGVSDALADAGEGLVFRTTVDPFNDSYVRGAQLAARIEAILATTGHAKVNIIGHSQGGLDARMAASLRPDLVASVTTYGTPNLGSPVADIGVGLIQHPQFAALVDGLVRAIGAPLWDEVGEATSVTSALYTFTSEGIAEFNARVLDQPGVAYYSIAGRSGWHRGGPDCFAEDPPAFIARYAQSVDPVDVLFVIGESILDGHFNRHPNDGLVRAIDARWGRFLGCVPADHLDQIGQLFNDLPGLVNPWRHRPFFVELVAWLRDQGH